MTTEQQRQDAIIEACLKDIENKMPHLPLVNKTIRERAFEAKQKQDKNKKKAWRKENAEDYQLARRQYAIKFAVGPYATSPLVLDVRTDVTDGAYYLSYWPADRMIGMRVLKALYETKEEEPQDHSDLLLALRPPDFLYQECPEELATHRALMVKHFGRADGLGRFERTYDVDDLGAMLYIQQCRFLGDY